MASETSPKRDEFDESQDLALKIEDFKFFFYGVIITVIITIIIQMLILPVHTQGLEYLYGTSVLFTTPISNIWYLFGIILVVLIVAFFIGYRFIAPLVMSIKYKNQSMITLPPSFNRPADMSAWEDLKRIAISRGEMNGLTPIPEKNQVTIRGNFINDIKVIVCWDTSEKEVTKIKISWVNNAKSIKVAKEIHDEFLDKISPKENKPIGNWITRGLGEFYEPESDFDPEPHE